MYKKLLFLVLLLTVSTMFGQNWEKTQEDSTDDVVFVKSHMPSQFQLYSIDLDEIRNQLQYVELKDEVSVGNSTTIINFPNEDGTMEQYKMLEWSIMEDELQAKFPMIRTYIGQSVTNPSKSLNMSIGTDGLHVMFHRPGQAGMYIDPFTKDRSKYILYTKNNLPAVEGEFICEYKNEVETQTEFDFDDIPQQRSQDGKLRTYRLAVACTIEYSAYHLTNQGVSNGASLAVKKAAVMSAITTTIARVSGVYKLELGVAFSLVGQNQDIVFINSDNFSNNNPGALIDESQTQITNIIGVGAFDVGHTFSTGGGGLAGKGVICFSNNKASGITGSNQPIGDAYDIDYVAHELGHQFGCDHTFNTNTATNSCGAQRNASTAGEPGGGSTIMAYAGICGATPNVQNNSDAYFHYFSLLEINTRTTSNSYPQCASLQNTGNVEPTANAGADVVIPKGTAYILEGQSTDDNSTPLFCWEQIDTQYSQEGLSATATQGPSYRSLIPTTSPDRYMPKFTTVLSGSLQSQWEVTPTVARSMTFAMTTRDNDPNGGQTNVDLKAVNVSGTAGPFVVTSQTASETWATGENKTIVWNVANTTGFGVNTAFVKISLVDSNGSELAVLVASTDNDGSATITVPNITSSNTRVMVRAIDNIFYAINSANILVNVSCIVCTSTGTTQFETGTRLVEFNTINHTTPLDKTAGYTATGESTTVNRNDTYNLTVNVNTDGPYTTKTKVWIDWNQNCSFNDAGEEYDLGSANNVTDGATSASPFAVTVPVGAVLGNTVMRVSTKYNSYATSCETSFDGEVEDYVIIVDNAAAVNDINNFDGFVLSPNPNEGNFNISLLSNNSNDVSIKVYDMIGRQIYSRNFDNNQSNFNQNIKLSNVQPGMYLVNISDGVRFNSEKIIIK